MNRSLSYLLFSLLIIRISPDMQAQDLFRENEMVRSDLFREKFHLFTDRNIYAVNEKIFFRAFNLSESRLKQ
ncbi:MAG: hypothetical protein KAT38_07785, partial [Bacteroidales bacterium]|nr:hypothetical protein [Bacteroidales bacterium]